MFNEILDSLIIGQFIDIYQLIYHADGIQGAISGTASEYAKNYIIDVPASTLDKFGDVAKTTLGWATTLVTVLVESAISAINIPNPHDIDIYKRLAPDKNNSDTIYAKFNTVIEGHDGEVSMEDVVEKFSRDNT